LEDAVDGAEIAHKTRGVGYLISSRVEALEEVGSVNAAFEAEMSSPESVLHQRLFEACAVNDLSPDDLIFLDLETTGLGNSPLFLIGIMVWHEGGLEVQQFIARDYAEEAAVISLFLEICAAKRLLITFNGKSFDFPYVRTRAIANGIPFTVDPDHFDMLHECRKIWRSSLPDCKLQTLETYICGRPRYGDIPGGEIPEAYHAYVRTDNAYQIVEVLKHNMLDLVTMADLMTRFPKLDDRVPVDRR